MVVRTVNYNLPNEEGNVNIQMLEGPRGEQGIQGPRGIQGMTGDRGPRGEQGPIGPKGDTGPQGLQGDKGDKGDKGDSGVIFHGLNDVKCFIGKTSTVDGTWTINYSDVGFTQVLIVQATLQYTDHSDSERPLGCYVRSANNTSASGEAFSVSSAGLLAAMQQIEVKDGTIVNVTVLGI